MHLIASIRLKGLDLLGYPGAARSICRRRSSEEFLYRLGQCNVEHLGDLKAVVCFEQVLEQSPTHESAYSLLKACLTGMSAWLSHLLDAAYRESEDYRKLHDMNAVLAAETQDENTRLNLLLALAEFAE